MRKINIIGNELRQNFQFQIETGNQIEFELEYRPQQLGWFMSLKYNQYEFREIRLTVCDNLLRRARNYLPFGIAVKTTDGYEPLSQDDFASGYAKFYVLDKTEVGLVEDIVYVRT